MKWELNLEAEPQGSSDGFWYDLAFGGYIKPDELLKNPEQVKKVNEAVQLLISFNEALKENELLNEF